jgi:predicted nucleic acid-binding protein
MPAIIRDISDPSLRIPDSIMLDTSLLLELVPDIQSHPHHQIAVKFLNRLRVATRRREVIPIIPYLVLEEFYFKICQMYLQTAGQQSGIKWHEYYKQNPQFISAKVHPVLVQFYQILQAFPIMILESEDLSVTSASRIPSISDCMTDHIGWFNILPKDATILCEAKRVGVLHVATLDKDFERADGFTVFLPL